MFMQMSIDMSTNVYSDAHMHITCMFMHMPMQPEHLDEMLRSEKAHQGLKS